MKKRRKIVSSSTSSTLVSWIRPIIIAGVTVTMVQACAASIFTENLTDKVVACLNGGFFLFLCIFLMTRSFLRLKLADEGDNIIADVVDKGVNPKSIGFFSSPISLLRNIRYCPVVKYKYNGDERQGFATAIKRENIDNISIGDRIEVVLDKSGNIIDKQLERKILKIILRISVLILVFTIHGLIGNGITFFVSRGLLAVELIVLACKSVRGKINTLKNIGNI